jgi:hypothetical protein
MLVTHSMRLDLGEILALSLLLIAAGGLLFAALYAGFGKPATAEGRKRKQHIVNGFRAGVGILLGFALVGTFVAAVGVGIFGAKLESAPLSFSSKPLALGLAAISLALITLLAQRWAKFLAGFIGYGVLNGLLMASSGRLLTNTAIPISRLLALTITGIAIVSAFLCRRFTEDYELGLVDRIAVVGWVVCLAVGLNVGKYGLGAKAVGGIGLLFAWWYHRLIRRSLSHNRGRLRTSNTI